MWQAALALGVAVVGFFGVALGAVVTGYVTLRQARLTTEREHQLRQIEWARARKDTHDAFQREAIINLQDAVSAYWRLVVDAHYQVHPAVKAAQEKVDFDFDTVFSPLKPAYWQMAAARARVLDDELRRLVKDLGVHAVVATSLETRVAREGLEVCDQLRAQIEERVNALLRQLF